MRTHCEIEIEGKLRVKDHAEGRRITRQLPRLGFEGPYPIVITDTYLPPSGKRKRWERYRIERKRGKKGVKYSTSTKHPVRGANGTDNIRVREERFRLPKPKKFFAECPTSTQLEVLFGIKTRSEWKGKYAGYNIKVCYDRPRWEPGSAGYLEIEVLLRRKAGPKAINGAKAAIATFAYTLLGEHGRFIPESSRDMLAIANKKAVKSRVESIDRSKVA